MTEEKKNKGNQTMTVNVTSGSFPLNLFMEWDKDCKENFGNCRWMKMWHDHLVAKKFSIFLKLFDEIEMIKEQLNEMKNKKPQKTLTLGGLEDEGGE